MLSEMIIYCILSFNSLHHCIEGVSLLENILAVLSISLLTFLVAKFHQI